MLEYEGLCLPLFYILSLIPHFSCFISMCLCRFDTVRDLVLLSRRCFWNLRYQKQGRIIENSNKEFLFRFVFFQVYMIDSYVWITIKKKVALWTSYTEIYSIQLRKEILAGWILNVSYFNFKYLRPLSLCHNDRMTQYYRLCQIREK